jgi:hypothetical protein
MPASDPLVGSHAYAEIQTWISLKSIFDPRR